MADLVAQVADQRAVGLVHLRAHRLAMDVVGLLDVQRDQAVVVARHHARAADGRAQQVEHHALFRVLAHLATPPAASARSAATPARAWPAPPSATARRCRGRSDRAPCGRAGTSGRTASAAPPRCRAAASCRARRTSSWRSGDRWSAAPSCPRRACAWRETPAGRAWARAGAAARGRGRSPAACRRPGRRRCGRRRGGRSGSGRRGGRWAWSEQRRHEPTGKGGQGVHRRCEASAAPVSSALAIAGVHRRDRRSVRRAPDWRLRGRRAPHFPHAAMNTPPHRLPPPSAAPVARRPGDDPRGRRRDVLDAFVHPDGAGRLGRADDDRAAGEGASRPAPHPRLNGRPRATGGRAPGRACRLLKLKRSRDGCR